LSYDKEYEYGTLVNTPLIVGNSVGCAFIDGVLVGDLDGLPECNFVGVMDGVVDGSRECVSVGVFDDTLVGDADGEELGSRE